MQVMERGGVLVLAVPPAEVGFAGFIMRTALAQVNTTVGDFDGNAEKILEFTRRAQARGAGWPAADAAALLCDGKVLLDYTKVLLPTYDVFDEGRYFEPGCAPAVYRSGSQQIATTICEYIWNDKNFWEKRLYARDPVEEAVKQGADLRD